MVVDFFYVGFGFFVDVLLEGGIGCFDDYGDFVGVGDDIE